jgi:hypothetical protein
MTKCTCGVRPVAFRLNLSEHEEPIHTTTLATRRGNGNHQEGGRRGGGFARNFKYKQHFVQLLLPLDQLLIKPAQSRLCLDNNNIIKRNLEYYWVSAAF